MKFSECEELSGGRLQNALMGGTKFKLSMLRKTYMSAKQFLWFTHLFAVQQIY